MTGAPTPGEIFDRAVEEGDRRLDQSLLELAATSFIAGFTIVFGLVALGAVEQTVPPGAGDLDRLAGALAFGVGVMFLVAGRTELFNENFADPVAAAVERGDRRMAGALLRLWTVTLVFNLLGGALFSLVFAVDGSLPPGTAESLAAIAAESAHRELLASFARAIVGGALVSLLSFLLAALESDGSRLWTAYAVGVLLALGPFEHVVVTALVLFLGALFGSGVDVVTVAETAFVVTAGNLAGGLGLVTVTHILQAAGVSRSSE